MRDRSAIANTRSAEVEVSHCWIPPSRFTAPRPVWYQFGTASGLSGPLSPRAVAAMRAEIERERAELLAKKGLAEGELNRTQQELQRREEELTRAQEQHQDLEQKLQDLQSKVIVGGVNLLEQAEHQERLLEASAQELAARKKKETKLRRQLREKEAEHQDMEEKYASLQEAAVGKTKRLKEVWKQFQQAKEEVREPCEGASY